MGTAAVRLYNNNILQPQDMLTHPRCECSTHLSIGWTVLLGSATICRYALSASFGPALAPAAAAEAAALNLLASLYCTCIGIGKSAATC